MILVEIAVGTTVVIRAGIMAATMAHPATKVMAMATIAAIKAAKAQV